MSKNMFSTITNLFKKEGDKNLACPDTGDNDCARSMTTTDRSPGDKSSHPHSPLAPTPKTLQPSTMEVKKQVSATSSRRGSGVSVSSVNDEQASSSRSQGDRAGLLGLLDYPAPSGPAPTHFPGATDRGRGAHRMSEGSNAFQHGHMGNNRPQKLRFSRSNSNADNDGAWRSQSANNSQGLLGDGSMRSESSWRARSTPGQHSQSVSPGPFFRQSSRPKLQSQSSILGDAPDRPSGTYNFSRSSVSDYSQVNNQHRPPFQRSPNSLLGEGPASGVSDRSQGACLLGDGNSARSDRSMGVGLLGDAPTPGSHRSSGRFQGSPNRPRFSRTNTGNSILGNPSPSTSPSMPPQGRSSGGVPELTRLAMAASATASEGPAGSLSRTLSHRSESCQSRSDAEYSPSESRPSILGEPPAHLIPLGINPHPSKSRIGSHEPRKSFPSLDRALAKLALDSPVNFEGRFSYGSLPLGATPLAPPNSVASLSGIVPNRKSYSSLPGKNRSSIGNLPQSNSTRSLNLNFRGRFSRNSSSGILGQVGSPTPLAFRHSNSLDNGRVFDSGRIMQSPTASVGMPVVKEGTPLGDCSRSERSAESSSRSGPLGPDSTIGFRMQRTNGCLIELVA